MLLDLHLHDYGVLQCPCKNFAMLKALKLIEALQTLTDLNDFITPSQVCIKPVEQTNKSGPRDPDSAEVCTLCHLRSEAPLINLIDGRPRYR